MPDDANINDYINLIINYSNLECQLIYCKRSEAEIIKEFG